MPGAGQSHHVMFQDSSGGNKTGLRLLEDAEGKLLYGWELAPALAPGVDAKDVQYGQYDPSQELVWSQDDWQGGALRFYYNPRDPAKYGFSRRVWALTPNELSVMPSPQDLTIGVKNGGAQLGATTGWTVTGGAAAISAADSSIAPYAGVYMMKLTTFVNGGTAVLNLTATGETATRYQGKTITASCRVASSTSTQTVRLAIQESGGASTPTTNGASVALSTAWKELTVSVVLQADTTTIEVYVNNTSGSTIDTMLVDQVQVEASAASGSATGMNANGVRMVAMGGALYMATQQALYKFDETNDYWSLQKVFGATITGMEIFDNRIYIGQGGSTAYEYSGANDATTWTTSTLASTGKNAVYFGKVVNSNGNWALAKTLTNDSVHLATDPTNSGSWGSALDVGLADAAMTNLHELGGALAVGKQDGFYLYLTLDGNRFVNTYPGANKCLDANNFSRSVTHNGWLYTVTAELGFVRTDGYQWQSLNNVIQAPGFSDFGNRVRGLGTDGRLLFLLVEDLAAASITKTCWLLALEEQRDGWRAHTLNQLQLIDATDMFMFKSTGGAYRSLFIVGNTNTNYAMSYRLAFPTRTVTPRLLSGVSDVEFNLTSTGSGGVYENYFVTSYWDGNRPQVQKVAHSLELLSEGLAAGSTVEVFYMKDNETSWTAINSSDSIFETSPYQSIDFNSNVSFRRIRLRFSFTGTTSAIPVIKAFVLHMHWRPDRLQQWLLVGAIEDGLRGLQGAAPALPAKQMLTQLATLRDAKADVTFTDIDGTTHTGHIVDMKETQVKGRVGSGGQAVYSRGVQILFQEG